MITAYITKYPCVKKSNISFDEVILLYVSYVLPILLDARCCLPSLKLCLHKSHHTVKIPEVYLMLDQRDGSLIKGCCLHSKEKLITGLIVVTCSCMLGGKTIL